MATSDHNKKSTVLLKKNHSKLIEPLINGYQYSKRMFTLEQQLMIKDIKSAVLQLKRRIDKQAIKQSQIANTMLIQQKFNARQCTPSITISNYKIEQQQLMKLRLIFRRSNKLPEKNIQDIVNFLMQSKKQQNITTCIKFLFSNQWNICEKNGVNFTAKHPVEAYVQTKYEIFVARLKGEINRKVRKIKNVNKNNRNDLDQFD